MDQKVAIILKTIQNQNQKRLFMKLLYKLSPLNDVVIEFYATLQQFLLRMFSSMTFQPLCFVGYLRGMDVQISISLMDR